MTARAVRQSEREASASKPGEPGGAESRFFLRRGPSAKPARAGLLSTVSAGNYEKTTLENGIRVVTERVPGARSLAIGVLVDAGPRDEDAGQEGLAHLAEHMSFAGTTSRDDGEIGRFIDSAGGAIGGFTGRDYTCYFATVVDDYRYHALDLLGDLLLNSIFPEARLAAQKQAIELEILGARDAPAARAEAQMKGRIWPDSHLGRPIAGRPETVAALTREDVIYFIHRHYSPERIIVAGAGNLHHQDFVDNVTDAFWRLLGESPVLSGGSPDLQSGLDLEEAPLSQTYFSLALPGLRYDHPDRYALHVLCQLLGGGASSRLYRRIREDRGLAYRIETEYHAYREAGVVVVSGATGAANAAAVCRAIQEVVADVVPVTEDELVRVKTQLKTRHLLAGEDLQARMSRLATQELYFGSHLAPSEVLRGIEEVDAQALERVAGRLARIAALSLVGPGVEEHRSSLEKILSPPAPWPNPAGTGPAVSKEA